MSEDRCEWSAAELEIFYSAWKECNVLQQTKKISRRTTLYTAIHAKLADAGFTKTVKQVRVKYFTEVQKFKKVKDRNRTSGSNRNSCDRYEDLNEILGDKPGVNPPPGSIVDSLCEETDDVDSAGNNYGSEDLFDDKEAADNVVTVKTDANEHVAVNMEMSASLAGSSPLNSEGDQSSDIQRKSEAVKPPVSHSTRRRLSAAKAMQHSFQEIGDRMKASDERFYAFLADESQRQREERRLEQEERRKEREHELAMMRTMLASFATSSAPPQNLGAPFYAPPAAAVVTPTDPRYITLDRMHWAESDHPDLAPYSRYRDNAPSNYRQ